MAERGIYQVTISFEIVPYRATEGRWRDLLGQRAPALAVGLGSYRNLTVEVAGADPAGQEAHG